jgi:uncharacterized protein (TIGR03437 family)
VAGSADRGDGGPAPTAEFGNIEGLACDRSGNVYLSDTDSPRVRKISTDGVVTTVAGTGTAGFGGDGGPATQALLNMPYGLAAGPAGDLYIADLGNHRVRHVSPDGTISTAAGNGACGSTGDGGPATAAALCGPRNIFLDRAGNLYISEFEGHRIRKVSPDGTISRIAGLGSPGAGGDGTPAALAQLAYPAGLAMDQRGILYVADSQNQRIRRITPDGWISTILDASKGAELLTPTGVAVDRNGIIYVTDQSYSVRSFAPDRSWVTVAGTGVAGFAGDGGAAAYAQLNSANDVAVDSDLTLYIADGVRVRRVNTEGVIQTVAGDGYRSAVGDGGRATQARLFRPSAVALDQAGNLYIADTGTERVRKVAVAGSIESVAGTGTAGSPVNAPMGVALDGAGNLFFADTGNDRVQRVTADGAISTVAGAGRAGVNLTGPRGICVGPNDALFVVDSLNHRVLRVGPDARAVLVAGNGLLGDSGDEGPAIDARLHQPTACAVDADGNLLIADTLNHRIRRVTADGIISAVAGTGLAGSSGDEGPARVARLSAPAGVAADRAGNIFVSDTGNHRIRQITPDGTIHTIAGGDGPGFAGDGGLASAALLNAPGGLQADAAGNLYFPDTNNNRVRRLTPQAVLPPPPLVELSALNAASLREGPVAPGEILTVFGQSLGPAEGVAGIFDAAGVLASNAGGTEVRFDGIAAPVFYAQDRQVNVQVPYTVAGRDTTLLEIRYQGRIARMTLAVVDAAPALFPVAANQDGAPNSAAEPAPRGTVVTVYGTGDGLTDGSNQTGRAAEAPYAHPRLSVSLTIGGVYTEILYVGSAPGLVGVFQVNARMPGGYVQPGAASLVLTVGRASAPPLPIWLR